MTPPGVCPDKAVKPIYKNKRRLEITYWHLCNSGFDNQAFNSFPIDHAFLRSHQYVKKNSCEVLASCLYNRHQNVKSGDIKSERSAILFNVIMIKIFYPDWGYDIS